MISGKNLKYQLRSTQEIKLPVLTEPGQEIQKDFSGELHNKHVTGEPYILTKIDQHSKWPVVRVCKSTGTHEDKEFFESLINLHKSSPNEKR